MLLTREEKGRRRIYNEVQSKLFEVTHLMDQHNDLFTKEELNFIESVAVKYANQVIDLDLKEEDE